MTDDLAAVDRQGVAAGVPYVALAPANPVPASPIVAVLHLMDPPRSERAMAAALPLRGVDAWRVYFGLPMFGERAPAGGMDEVMRLGAEDALMNVYVPVIEGAAAELPGALDAVREHLGLSTSQVALVGGSAGGAAVLLALAESPMPIAAAVLINPASRISAVIEAGEAFFGVTYPWDDERRARADHLDFVRRAPEILARSPHVPLMLVAGEDEESPQIRASNDALAEVLRAGYAGELGVAQVPGLGHALAEEPGIDAAPQTSGAAVVDREVTGWLNAHLGGAGAQA